MTGFNPFPNFSDKSVWCLSGVWILFGFFVRCLSDQILSVSIPSAVRIKKKLSVVYLLAEDETEVPGFCPPLVPRRVPLATSDTDFHLEGPSNLSWDRSLFFQETARSVDVLKDRLLFVKRLSTLTLDRPLWWPSTFPPFGPFTFPSLWTVDIIRCTFSLNCSLFA